jgi:hypothetical protein
MVRPRERHSAAACAGSSAGQSEELSRHTRPGHSRSAAARPVLAIHYVLGLAVAIWRAVSAGAGRSQAHHSGCGDQSSATSAPTGGDKASRAHVPGASSISGAAPPTPPQISCAHAAGSLLTLRNRRTGGAPQGRSPGGSARRGCHRRRENQCTAPARPLGESLLFWLLRRACNPSLRTLIFGEFPNLHCENARC